MALGDTLKSYVIGVGVKDNNFTAGLKNMGGQLRTFVSQMGLMLGAGSLGMAFKKFIDTGTDISNFSSLTGIAEQDITALGGVLEQFGGNVDSAKSSLQALQQGLSQAEWGQGQLLETAALYGVELYNQDGSLKNAQALLMGLADDFQHLTKAQQFTLGTQLGLDESTILLLQQGKTSIKALLAEQQKMGAMNAKQAADAKKFHTEWTKLKQSLGSLGRSIAVDIMPPVIDFVKQLGKAVDWVRSLDTYTIVLAGSFGVLGYAVKNFTQIATFFTKSFWKANLPLVALLAGLTVLFLLIEDIVGYFNGKESLFGKFLENEKVQKFIAWFKDMKESASGIWDGLVDGFYKKFDAIAYVFKNLGTLLKIQVFETINEIIDKFNGMSFFGKKLNISKLEVPTIDSMQEYHDEKQKEREEKKNNANDKSNIKNMVGNIIPAVKLFSLITSFKNTDELPAVKNGVVNNNTNNNTQNNNVTVNVQSTGDSLQDITKAVEKGFNLNYISSALLLNGAK